MKRRTLEILSLLFCMTVIVCSANSVAADNDDIPRMTVEQLKKLLDDPEAEILILDVRTGSSWTDSKTMITSAVYEDATDFTAWAKKHPKEKTIVLYCT